MMDSGNVHINHRQILIEIRLREDTAVTKACIVDKDRDRQLRCPRKDPVTLLSL